MATIMSHKETNTVIDADGKETTTVKESTTKYEPCAEPDYIKLYTNMWCEFNQIPINWRPLFLELVAKMTYCDANDLKHSQIVQTGSIFGDAIKERLDIGQRQYQKGIKALVECGAIRKIENRRGVYQVNPSYAGRGEWKYNPKLARGGVEDLIATFNFKEGTVDVDVVWGDDGKDTELNETYRKGLGVSKKNNATLKTIKKTKTKKDSPQQEQQEDDQIPGQLDLEHWDDNMEDAINE